jgi:hypothetical protein
MLTQPLMYKKIAAHPGTRKLYGDKLVTQVLPADGPDAMVAYRAAMDAGRHTVDQVLTNFKSKYAVDWSPYLARSGPTPPTPPSRWPSGSAWPSASPPCPRASPFTTWSRRCWTTAPPWAAAR